MGVMHKSKESRQSGPTFLPVDPVAPVIKNFELIVFLSGLTYKFGSYQSVTILSNCNCLILFSLILICDTV